MLLPHFADDLVSIPRCRNILTLLETKRAIVSLFSRFLIRPARVDAAFGFLVDSLSWLGCWEWNEGVSRLLPVAGSESVTKRAT
jgi:hypothetical protein